MPAKRNNTAAENAVRAGSQVQAERDALRTMLVKLTKAVSISQFHGLLCEAKELLAAHGVDLPDGAQKE